MRELREYLGTRWEPERTHEPSRRLAEEWNESPPAGEAETLEWYRGAEGYLYDLTAWHATAHRADWRARLLSYCQSHSLRRVLDYGCGIGEDGLLLAEAGLRVTFADLDCPSLAYLRWRLRRRGLEAEVVTLGTGRDLVGGWDLGICLDVLEHLTRPIPTLELLAAGCSHLAVNWPLPDPSHPMHISQGSAEWELRHRGWEAVGTEPPVYRRRQ